MEAEEVSEGDDAEEFDGFEDQDEDDADGDEGGERGDDEEGAVDDASGEGFAAGAGAAGLEFVAPEFGQQADHRIALSRRLRSHPARSCPAAPTVSGNA